MDIKMIKKLSDFMKAENIRNLEITEKDGTSVRLEKYDGAPVVQTAGRAVQAHDAGVIANVQNAGAKDVHVAVVKSPLVGIFYAAPSPDAPTFVSVGAKVRKGDVLCIIEAMKQMNEIVAEEDGEVAEICAANGDIVEYDQVLFRMGK